MVAVVPLINGCKALFERNVTIALQRFAIVIRCLSVVCLSVTRVCCEKNNCKQDHAVFTMKQREVSTVSMVSLKTKFGRGPLDRGLDLCYGGLGLRQTVATGVHIAYLHMTSHVITGQLIIAVSTGAINTGELPTSCQVQ